MGRHHLPSRKDMERERSKIRNNIKTNDNNSHFSNLVLVSLIILSLALLVFNTTNSIPVDLTHI